MFCWKLLLGLFALRKSSQRKHGPIHEGPCYTFFTQRQIYLCPVRVSIQHIRGVANPKKHYIFEYWRLMHDIFMVLYPPEWSTITWMVNILFRKKIGTWNVFYKTKYFPLPRLQSSPKEFLLLLWLQWLTVQLYELSSTPSHFSIKLPYSHT